jgi:hypothetical protein
MSEPLAIPPLEDIQNRIRAVHVELKALRQLERYARALEDSEAARAGRLERYQRLPFDDDAKTN